MRNKNILLALFASTLLSGAALAAPGMVSADVSTARDGSQILQWRTTHPYMNVAIYTQAEDGSSRQLLRSDGLARGYTRIEASGGAAEGNARPAPHFYLVVDGGKKDPKEDGIVARPRVVALEQASNFRDLGGYMSEDGRTVRWGKIYRSGAPVLLTDNDLAHLETRNIKTSVDLRSNEERELSPSQLDTPGRTLIARDYSMLDLLPLDADGNFDLSQSQSGGYGDSILDLAPLYRTIFAALLEDKGAVHYNCSAGQDRTGVASALILSALGVPRDQILRDYQMSTELRDTRYELRKFDPADYPGNKVAALFAIAGKESSGVPDPLFAADGISILAATFDAIDQKWGSTLAFLQAEIGLSDKDIAQLKDIYLE